MNDQLALQNLLRHRLGEIRLKNPSFSLRAFANRLNLNSGALSGFLAGKRRVSGKMALRITNALGLDPQERAEVLAPFEAVQEGSTQGASRRSLKYLQISADQYRLIAKWHHFAVLSLIRTRGFRSSPDWIAKRLGITPTQAKEALARLKRLGMISVDPAGKIRRGESKYRTTDDVVNLSLQQAHAENLEIAKEALVKTSVQNRDFTAATMAVDPRQLPKAKELIRKFQDDLAELLESGDQTEVYKICIQLFPLTVLKEGETR